MNATTDFATAAAAQEPAAALSLKHITFKALADTIIALHMVKTHLEGLDMEKQMNPFPEDNLDIVYNDAYQEFLIEGQSPLFGEGADNNLNVLRNAAQDLLQDGQISVDDMALVESVVGFAEDVEDIRTLLVSNLERTGEDEFDHVDPKGVYKHNELTSALEAGRQYVEEHLNVSEIQGESFIIEGGVSISNEAVITQAENHIEATRLAIKLIDQALLQGKDIAVRLAEGDDDLQLAGLELDDAITAAEGDVIDTFAPLLDTRPVLVYIV